MAPQAFAINPHLSKGKFDIKPLTKPDKKESPAPWALTTVDLKD